VGESKPNRWRGSPPSAYLASFSGENRVSGDGLPKGLTQRRRARAEWFRRQARDRCLADWRNRSSSPQSDTSQKWKVRAALGENSGGLTLLRELQRSYFQADQIPGPHYQGPHSASTYGMMTAVRTWETSFAIVAVLAEVVVVQPAASARFAMYQALVVPNLVGRAVRSAEMDAAWISVDQGEHSDGVDPFGKISTKVDCSDTLRTLASSSCITLSIAGVLFRIHPADGSALGHRV